MVPGRWQASASEYQSNMRKPTRSELKAQIQDKGIVSAMRIGKTGLTKKQQRFAEGVVLDGLTASDAYRQAYDTQAKPNTVNVNAHKLTRNAKVANTIEALERAKELAAWHSAESLRSLVISTLTEVATSETAKDATRVAAVKVLGTVVGVDAFRETKRVEHIQNSDAIREQILGQLKTMMLASDDAETIDADSLLEELAGAEPHPEGTPPNAERDSDAHMHTNPLKQSPENSDLSQSSEDPPSSLETQTPGGDIFGENDEVAK